jgi:apolipoprotein N-acyltransferase
VPGVSWPLPIRLLVAGLSGWTLSLAFAPYGIWWLLPVAVAGVTLACTGVGAGRGALVGLAGGLGFFLTLLDWMQVVGTDAWVGLAVLQALFWAGLGAGLAVVAGLPAWPLWTTAVWVLVEALRSVVPWGGFPWGRLAHALVDSPILGVVHLGGATLLSAVGATIGTLLAGLAVALLDHDARRSAGAAALIAALVAVGVGAGTLVSPPPVTGTATAAIVQGNVPRLGLDFLGQREAVLTNHLEATATLADDVRSGVAPQPDLVLWPENSSDIDPFTDPAVRDRIDAAVADIGAPTLVGVLVGTEAGEQVENTAIVWDPVTGAGERYVKRHPVPFGEYIPGRALLTPLIGRLDRIPRDMRAGDTPGVLSVGPTQAGVVICFEIAYDAEVRDTVATGAQMLVVQTNNATYGRTGQPDQQFDISRLRAVEHGRDVLIASTSGISAVIRADGTVEQSTEEFTQTVLVDTVDLRDDIAWATRSGAVVSWLLAGVGVAGIIGGAAARRRARTEESA